MKNSRRSLTSSNNYIWITVLIIFVIYWWLISAGTFFNFVIDNPQNYYDMLGEAFYHGQTSLMFNPPIELLQLSDPYDPILNAKYKIWDALLYKGKYYFYWGPVPGLIVCVLKFLGIKHTCDSELLLFFITGLLIFKTLLLVEIQKLYFSSLSIFYIVISIIFLGMDPAITFLLGRPAIYEVAIASGQFFIFGGIFFAFKAIGSRERESRFLFICGLLFSFALGSRISLAPVIIILSFLIIYRIYYKEFNCSTTNFFNKCILPIITPIIISFLALINYNFQRFGSIFEFGLRYQLAGFNTHKYIRHLMSFTNIPSNLYIYLFNPIQSISHFPYRLIGNSSIISNKFNGSVINSYLPAIIPSPSFYFGESISGILKISSLDYFAAISVLLLVLYFLNSYISKYLLRLHFIHNRILQFNSFVDSNHIWLVSFFLASTLFSIFTLLFFGGSTMRYLADFSSSLSFLSLFGIYIVMFIFKKKKLLNIVFKIIVFILILNSSFNGLLLPVTGYFGNFQSNNPHFFNFLVDHLPLIN